MEGEVIDNSSLLPVDSRSNVREVTLVKVKLPGHASYEPGVCALGGHRLQNLSTDRQAAEAAPPMQQVLVPRG